MPSENLDPPSRRIRRGSTERIRKWFRGTLVAARLPLTHTEHRMTVRRTLRLAAGNRRRAVITAKWVRLRRPVQVAQTTRVSIGMVLRDLVVVQNGFQRLHSCSHRPPDTNPATQYAVRGTKPIVHSRQPSESHRPPVFIRSYIIGKRRPVYELPLAIAQL